MDIDRSKRRNDLDWLRVLAVGLLLYFHTAAVFYRGELGEFYVVNEVTSPSLGLFIMAIYQWHMPLFFFLAGAASWFALKRRTAQEYLTERFRRLFVPFVFGLFVLVPPQVYFSRLNRSQFQGSYFQFYPQFFNGIRPAGNFEWAHLWFVIYLFVLSIVALPLFIRVKNLRYSRFSIIGFALAVALIEATLRPRWFGFQNLYDDWANVLLYLSYLIYGYYFGAQPQFAETLNQFRAWLLVGAIAGMTVLLRFWLTDAVPDRGYSLPYMGYQAFRGINTWVWVLALISLGHRFLSFRNSWLDYLNEASYPFYILHQPVIVSVAFYVVQLPLGIAEKFCMISIISLIVTGLVYEFLVRRVAGMRSLFGLK